MSGFAFQKLNGDQTTAHNQLNELVDANGKLEAANGKLDDANSKLQAVRDRLLVIQGTLAEIRDAVVHPEIWKLARMFHPDATLTPVQWVRHQNGTGVISTDGKLYYGRLQLTLTIYNFKDRSRQWMEAGVAKDGHEQAKFVAMHYKNSHGDYPGVHEEYIGYFDAITVWSNCDSQGRFEFQGFEVGAAGSAPPPFVPPAPEPEYEIRVHGLAPSAFSTVSYISGGQQFFVFDGTSVLPADATHVRIDGSSDFWHWAVYYKVGTLLAHSEPSIVAPPTVHMINLPAGLDGDVDVVFGAADGPLPPPNPMAPAPPPPAPNPPGANPPPPSGGGSGQNYLLVEFPMVSSLVPPITGFEIIRSDSLSVGDFEVSGSGPQIVPIDVDADYALGFSYSFEVYDSWFTQSGFGFQPVFYGVLDGSGTGIIQGYLQMGGPNSFTIPPGARKIVF